MAELRLIYDRVGCNPSFNFSEFQILRHNRRDPHKPLADH